MIWPYLLTVNVNSSAFFPPCSLPELQLHNVYICHFFLKQTTIPSIFYAFPLPITFIQGTFAFSSPNLH